MSLAIVVNSCKNFADTTMPVILDSLAVAGIPRSALYFIIGECDSESIDTSREYTVVNTDYFNIDFTAAVYLTQTDHGKSILQSHTHIFYTHDTVRFLKEFWATLHTHLSSCASYRKLQHVSSKSTGLFNTTWLLREKSLVLKHLANKNPDYRYAYKTSDGIPNEDIIRATCPRLPQWLNEDVLFDFAENFEPQGDCFVNLSHVRTYFEDVYKTGDVRKAYVYSPPGFVKYQRNFNVTANKWSMTL